MIQIFTEVQPAHTEPGPSFTLIDLVADLGLFFYPDQEVANRPDSSADRFFTCADFGTGIPALVDTPPAPYSLERDYTGDCVLSL